MKTLIKILLFLFIAVSLFVARDDVGDVYSRAMSYVASKMDTIPEGSTRDKIDEASDSITSFVNSVSTPGPLKGKYDLVSNAGKVKLSVADVVLWTNKNRSANDNLLALKESNQLDASASIKLADMFAQQYFEHDSPDGQGVEDLAKKVSYKSIMIGENLAYGNFKNAEALLNAWMDSPGHRANILKKNYTEIGVAVGHGNYNGQDVWMAVQHFGLPKSACPIVDEASHGIILIKDKEIQAFKVDLDTRNTKIKSGVVYKGMTTSEQIKEYNLLVVKYNQLIIDVNKLKSTYNAQVRAFNACRDKAVNDK